MTLNLTNWEYFTFKLSYPSIDISKLVKINSRIKTPNVCELMDFDDYQIYKTQISENREIMRDLAKSRDFEKYLNVINDKKTNLKFSSYYLLPGNIFWNKFEPV